MNPVKLALVTRGGIVECTHYGDAVVADSNGSITASAGDPERIAYMRSSSKPLQALLVAQTGAPEHFAFTDREMAICCASHCGSSEHVEVILELLTKLGLCEGDLECGVHWPSSVDERNRLICAGEEPGPRHNNCSGKHCGMLASALMMGVPTADYSRPDHPVQQATLMNLAEMCNIAPERIQIGVDGCGVPTFGMPLRNMAIGYARLTSPELGCISSELAAASGVVCSAMQAAPVMVAGHGSFDSTLMEVAGDIVTCKGGAEGLQMIGVKGRNMGMAVRSSDGSFRGSRPAALSVLRELGVLTEDCWTQMESFASPKMRNCRDEVVGETVSALVLESHE